MNNVFSTTSIWKLLIGFLSCYGSNSSSSSLRSSSLESSVAFVKEGTVFSANAFVHLSLDVEFNQLPLLCQMTSTLGEKIGRTVNSTYDRDIVLQTHEDMYLLPPDIDYEPHQPTKEKQLQQQQHTLNLLMRRTNLSCQDIQIQMSNRNKKGLFLNIVSSVVGFFGGQALANLINGGTNREDIIRIDQGQIEMQKMMVEVTKKTQQMITQVEQEVATLKVQTLLAIFETQVGELEHVTQYYTAGIIALYAGHLHNFLLPVEVMQSLIPKLSQLAKEKGGNLPTTNVDEFYLYPVTFSKEGMTLRILMHIPIIDPRPLHVFRINTQPFVLTYEPLTFAKIHENNQLVVNFDQTAFAILQDLKCMKVTTNLRVCTNIMLSKNFDLSCASKLFQNHVRLLKDECPVRLLPQQEILYQHEEGWSIATKIPQTIRIQCLNGTTRNVQVIQELTIPEAFGCTITTKEHFFHVPSMDIGLSQEFHWTSMTIPNEIGQQLMEFLPPQEQRAQIDLNALVQRMEEESSTRRVIQNRTPEMLATVMIVVIIMIIAIVVCIWKDYCKARKQVAGVGSS